MIVLELVGAGKPILSPTPLPPPQRGGGGEAPPAAAPRSSRARPQGGLGSKGSPSGAGWEVYERSE